MVSLRTFHAALGYDLGLSGKSILLALVDKQKPTRQSFGARLRALRLHRGLSQADLAARMGSTSQSVISSWERGDSAPDVIQLFDLAEALDLRPELLLDARLVQVENLPRGVAAEVLRLARAIQRLIRPHHTQVPGKPSADRRTPAEP